MRARPTARHAGRNRAVRHMRAGGAGRWHWPTGEESEDQTRVLVAIEDEYRAYREVIAAGLQALRSGTEVAAVGLDQLEAELACLDLEVVICSRSGGTTEAEASSLGSNSPWIRRDRRRFPLAGAALNRPTPRWKRCSRSSTRPRESAEPEDTPRDESARGILGLRGSSRTPLTWRSEHADLLGGW